jgi:hypothetical protein
MDFQILQEATADDHEEISETASTRIETLTSIDTISQPSVLRGRGCFGKRQRSYQGDGRVGRVCSQEERRPFDLSSSHIWTTKSIARVTAVFIGVVDDETLLGTIVKWVSSSYRTFPLVTSFLAK